MARKDALLKISKILIARRNELRSRLNGNLQDLGGGSAGTGDVADAAFGSVGDEMASQLAELEAKELMQTEIALMRIKQGRYGVCEVCAKKIPVARMDALPYRITCVKCHAEVAKDAYWLETQMAADWDRVRDDADSEFDISVMEANLSS